MEETILKAIERAKQPGKFRENGFTAGVLYGDNIAAANSVKFKTNALNEIITRHGANAKVWLEYNNTKKFGFIKELQREPITRQVTHVDIQIVSKDQEIKLQIPVIFKGEDNLELRQLQLQVNKSDITVAGKMNLMPDSIQIDVSDMKLGDSITSDKFKLDKQLKLSEKEDTVYGVVVNKYLNASAEAETKTEIKAETETILP